MDAVLRTLMCHCVAELVRIHHTSEFLRSQLLRAATTLGLLLALAAVAESAERPNIVMILADDQSYRDFGFMGNDVVHTPNIDRLAEKSARYSNGYVPMSVCRPSLATLLTGLYPHQHGIHFNHPPPGLRAMRKMSGDEYRATRATTDYLIEHVPTLPRILARHGYACLQTGKHWEGSYRTAGFTDGMTLGKPADRISSVTGTRTQENGDRVAHGNGDAGLVIGRETMQPVYDFVTRCAGRQPFFVWYAPFLPHTPFDAPQRFRELYADLAVSPHMLPYYAEIARFDETVGNLLRFLEEQKLLKSTLIVFVCDNGFRPHASRKEVADGRSKLSGDEDGLRTPVLVRWDGRVEPGDHLELVHTVDIVPTILAAAELSRETTPRMRGVNLMPSAFGKSLSEDRPVFGAIFPNDAQTLGQPSRHVRGRWIRDGMFKLTVPGPASRPLPLSLYDLEQDPSEQVNLASEPRHAKLIRRMRRLLDEWWTADDDAGVTEPEPPIAPRQYWETREAKDH